MRHERDLKEKKKNFLFPVGLNIRGDERGRSKVTLLPLFLLRPHPSGSPPFHLWIFGVDRR